MGQLNFQGVKEKIRRTEKSLPKLQNCTPDAHTLQVCKALSYDLGKLHRLEESYWFLRVRSNELKDGDENTKYFHH